MSVDDHGLEVLKKSGLDIGATPKTDYALQTVDASKLTAPPNADNFTVTSNPTSDIFTFKLGATVLRTITVNYSDSTKTVMTSGIVS